MLNPKTTIQNTELKGGQTGNFGYIRGGIKCLGGLSDHFTPVMNHIFQ